MSAVRPMVTRWAGRPDAPCSAPGAFGTTFRDTVYRLESGKPTLATMRTTTRPCHHVGHMRRTTHSALTYIKPTVTPAFALRLRAVGFRSRLRSHARASAQAHAHHAAMSDCQLTHLTQLVCADGPFRAHELPFPPARPSRPIVGQTLHPA